MAITKTAHPKPEKAVSGDAALAKGINSLGDRADTNRVVASIERQTDLLLGKVKKTEADVNSDLQVQPEYFNVVDFR